MNTTATTDIDTMRTGSADQDSASSEEGMDLPPGQQVPSPSPSAVEEEEEDSNGSSAENVDIVGQSVWVVAWDSYVEDEDRGFSIVESVHSTEAKAVATVKQFVREHHPGDPSGGEELDKDDPRNAEAAKPFLDDPANWKMVEDEEHIEMGMGYQYDQFGNRRVAVWVKRLEVE